MKEPIVLLLFVNRQFIQLNPLNLVSHSHWHRFIANDQPFSGIDILHDRGLE
jgi:hypothetical protein